MKRIVPLFLLILFFYNTVGYLCVFGIQQHMLHEAVESKIKAGLPENVLTIVDVEENEKKPSPFLRINEEELSYRGNLYDIVKVEKRGNTTRYYLLNDIAEKELMAAFDKDVKSNNDSNANKNLGKNEIAKKMASDYFFDGKLPALFPDVTNFKFSFFSARLQIAYLPVVIAPPRLV